MTRIDFYVLSDQTKDASMRFACLLGLKGFQAAQPVHIHVENQQEAQALDELMWDYPKHRFLPHEVLSENGTGIASQTALEQITETSNESLSHGTNIPQIPIQIGIGNPTYTAGLLINLGHQVPAFFGRFDRLAEVVVGETKEQGRERYKHYRDRGYQIHHHDLNNWERTP